MTRIIDLQFDLMFDKNSVLQQIHVIDTCYDYWEAVEVSLMCGIGLKTFSRVFYVIS